MPRHSTSRGSRSARVAGALAAVALLAGAGTAGWALLRPDAGTAALAPRPAAPTGVTSSVPPASTAAPASAPPSGAPSGSQSGSPTASPTASATAPAGTGLSAADRGAGLVSRSFPQRGTGRLVVVPGSAPAPAGGKVVRVRVEVEGGLAVDGAAFAAFALSTLNDDRSWAHDGYRFARTDGAADVRLVLASPQTSARLCLPLKTFGRLSCHAGDVTVLTVYRWVNGIPEYGGDITGYRHYVVNHEVGHALGHGHQRCAGPGKRAPVMMQQTKGLLGCTPNGWPYPDA